MAMLGTIGVMKAGPIAYVQIKYKEVYVVHVDMVTPLLRPRVIIRWWKIGIYCVFSLN